MKMPSIDFIRNWEITSGVRMVTLAPELDTHKEVIRALSGRGIVVSAGHTNATFAQANAGFNAGITCGTHLFNAMRPLDHREPGVIGALLEDDRRYLGLIVDGIHIHPTIVNLVYRLKGCEKIFLVTDAIAALGKENGVYKLSDQEIPEVSGIQKNQTFCHRVDNGRKYISGLRGFDFLGLHTRKNYQC
jgi:N-acetylglucosamine-6-phosphate deacetylase